MTSTRLFDKNGLLVKDPQEPETEEQTKVEKTRDIYLTFSEELLIEAKKKLFPNELSLQEFISFIMLRMSISDRRVLDLVEDASRFSKQKSTKHKKKKRRGKDSEMTSDELYDFFDSLDKESVT